MLKLRRYMDITIRLFQSHPYAENIHSITASKSSDNQDGFLSEIPDTEANGRWPVLADLRQYANMAERLHGEVSSQARGNWL